MVDLTENECSYENREGINKISFPIRDFSFRSPESVVQNVVEPIRRILAADGDVLIHCMGDR